MLCCISHWQSQSIIVFSNSFSLSSWEGPLPVWFCQHAWGRIGFHKASLNGVWNQKTQLPQTSESSDVVPSARLLETIPVYMCTGVISAGLHRADDALQESCVSWEGIGLTASSFMSYLTVVINQSSSLLGKWRGLFLRKITILNFSVHSHIYDVLKEKGK